MKNFKKGIRTLKEKGLNPKLAIFGDTGFDSYNQRYFFMTSREEKIEVIYEKGYLEPFTVGGYIVFRTWEGERVEIEIRYPSSQLYASEKTRYTEWFFFEWLELTGEKIVAATDVDLDSFKEVMNLNLEEYRP